MSNKLVFEKCSDINENYPYLVVYHKDIDMALPFMEISLNEKRGLQYILDFQYFNKEIILTTEQWMSIYQQATLFLPEAIENYEQA